MASGNDALKKHHFWILAGIAPVCVLLAIVFMMTGVGGAIDAAYTEIKTTEDQVKTGNAPGTGMLTKLDVQKDNLIKVRGELWKKNWDKQERFFTWPEAPGGAFDQYNTKKFGASFRDFIANPNLLEIFKPAYSNAYAKLGESIGPTTFKGGWRSALRWVADWGVQSPNSNQLWLVMEDLWIQRAMLYPIGVVNKEITRFDLVRPDGGAPVPPKERTFRSHVWELELKVVPRESAQGGGQVLKGKLKNRTSQLQVLGVGSAMLVKVWFDPKLDLQPFDFRIEGAGVAGGESIEVPALPTHVIPAGTDVVEIAKVEQVLDRRTVPIRRLDQLALGYPSAKDYSKPLLNPSFWPDAAAPDAGAAPGAPTGSGMPMPSMDSGKAPGRGPGDFSGGSTTAGPGRAGGLRLIDVADGNKKRYVEVNEQLRRVPVAFTIVVDQMYANEVMVAYSNSPLRFETVQYHWQRFTDTLDQPAGTDPTAGGDDPNADEYTKAYSSIGSGLSSYGQPPGLKSGSPSVGAPSSGGPAPGGFSLGGFGIPGLGSEALSNVSEAQANSGLIQLTIYGNVSLYERYEPKKEGDATASPKTETAPVETAKPVPPADPAKPAAPAPMTTPPVAPPMTGDPVKPATPPPASTPPSAPAPAPMPEKPAPTPKPPM